MKNANLPLSKSGQLSVALNLFFVLIIAISITLVQVFGVLSFDDRWWDITVALLALITLTTFITGLIALLKYKDRSTLLYISLLISTLAVLFVLLHSLFIND